MIISQLLIINVIITLIHESGFIEYVDNWINNKWKFYHLPYPIRCNLCGVFWCGILFITITGNITLLNIALCLINAHLTKIVRPLFRLIENILLLIISKLNDLISDCFFITN